MKYKLFSQKVLKSELYVVVLPSIMWVDGMAVMFVAEMFLVLCTSDYAVGLAVTVDTSESLMGFIPLTFVLIYF